MGLSKTILIGSETSLQLCYNTVIKNFVATKYYLLVCNCNSNFMLGVLKHFNSVSSYSVAFTLHLIEN